MVEAIEKETESVRVQARDAPSSSSSCPPVVSAVDEEGGVLAGGVEEMHLDG